MLIRLTISLHELEEKNYSPIFMLAIYFLLSAEDPTGNENCLIACFSMISVASKNCSSLVEKWLEEIILCKCFHSSH